VTIDAHHHLWDPQLRHYPWLAGEALKPICRSYTMSDIRSAAGEAIRATVLVQTISSVRETEEFLHIAYDSQGFVAGVVGWVDLTGPDVPGAIQRLRSDSGGQSLVGIRHQAEDEPDPRWLLRADVDRGLRAVGAAGLVYDLLVRAPQRPAAHTVAERLPEVTFVLDHAGKPAIAAGERAPWTSWIAGMATLPNVVCKLSGLITESPWESWTAELIRPYAEHVLSCFGADRVMFGSDWPVCELAGSYTEVLELTHDVLSSASETERAEVLGGTATRVYQLNT
jgi:L-fuconolactonase